MNVQTLWTQSRFAAPYVRARWGRNPLFKKVAGLSAWFRPAADPCRIPAPLPGRVPARGPRVIAALAIALLGAVAVGDAAAQPWDVAPRRASWGSDYEWTQPGQLVEVSVMVDGRTAPLYLKAGAHDRRYVQAFRGRNYSIVVRNTTGRRVGFVMAVDGLNVVNGERTRLAHDEPMYVLDPWETATIRGWRTSLHDVRRFVFVDEERSYAERTGQGNGDLGWIRVHAFREHQPLAWRPAAPHPYRGDHGPREESEARRDEPGEAAPQKSRAGDLSGRAGVDANPGTGWGDRRHDPVSRVEFRAVRHATDRVTLRYEYESGLRALGIVPVRHRPAGRTWERERGEYGWAQPPRW